MILAVTATLVKKGFTVNIKADAGFEARFRNGDYAAAGGKLTDKSITLQSGNLNISTIPRRWHNYCFNLFSKDILLKVGQPLETEIGALKEYGNIISFLYPALNKPLVEKMAQRKVTAFG